MPVKRGLFCLIDIFKGDLRQICYTDLFAFEVLGTFGISNTVEELSL
jgi:hypothetical protein